MLVLSRKVTQSVVINCPDGTQIKVVFVEQIANHKIRLGFDAPQDYRIFREELQMEIDDGCA
jgi:carbon storage regulator CsrA